MADIPVLPIWVTKYEGNTSHLSLEEDGAYTRLLRLSWVTPFCQMPADDDWIMRRMRVDRATFDRVVRPILSEFFYKEDGAWKNRKLQEVFTDSVSKYEGRARGGKAAAKTKALKTHGKGVSAAQREHDANVMQPEPEPEPDPASLAASCAQARMAIRKSIGKGVADPDAFVDVSDKTLAKLLAAYDLHSVVLPVLRKVTHHERDQPLRKLSALKAAFAEHAQTTPAVSQNSGTPPDVTKPFPLPGGKASAVVSDFIERKGLAWAHRWLTGVEFEAKEIYAPDAYQAQRIDTDGGGVLRDHGYRVYYRNSGSDGQTDAG